MKLKILVLCTGNSARSQMAEGFLRQMAGNRIEASSAGTKPSTVNLLAIQVMGERGISLEGHRSKRLDEFRQQPFDYVITVCDNAAEACPAFPGPARRLHWSFPDPAAAQGSEDVRLAAFREVRDSIEAKLTAWLKTLEGGERQGDAADK